MLKSKINLNLSPYFDKMTLYYLYLGHARNSMFKFNDLKGMNIDFGPWILNIKIVVLKYAFEFLSSGS